MLKILLTLLLAAVVSTMGCGDETGKMGEDEDSGPDEDAGDSDTGEDCGAQEITDTGTGVTWKRCHAGGWWEWVAWKSECGCTGGMVNTKVWDEIEGACDPGWRAATAEELMSVLEDCDTWADIVDHGSGSCTNCPESEPCDSMFPGDGRFYWAATEANDSEGWNVAFNVGSVTSAGKGTQYYVRCVEE
ncbi:MAG: DUF1566 domain-containing protein [Deltaproteobacteria bacterium]|nr:DUF1566 domain-containing protein [Deltaproteobacteria bacterium]